MKKQYILFLMFALMWQLLFCKPSVFSHPLTEDIAKKHLGKPWVSHPLARNSPTGFDCTTYVEEVLAERYENPGLALNRIRYKDDGTGFFNRNHFMEEMWIPNALRHGIIAPVILSGASESSMEVDLAEWYRDNPEIVIKDNAYHHLANVQRRFTASISYIPTTRINEVLLDGLPEETVVFFLGCYYKTPYRWLLNENAVMVTHMGFLFGGHRLYHASFIQKQVVSENLTMYLLDHPYVCGFVFYEIMDITSPPQGFR
jgi:hypothetical protein